jgi:tetratricopeptide (TPR) repeat protein
VARFNLTTALLKLHYTKPALSELHELMNRLFGSHDWADRETALSALRAHPHILVRIRENQGNAILPQSWLAALYAQQGFAQLNLHDRTAAQRSFEIGLAIDRANDDVNLGLAQIAYDRSDYRRAIGYLHLVIAARPRRAEAHMLLGHALAAKGDWRSARPELETWASLQPWSGQAQIEVAQARSRLGDYAGAQMSLEYALAHSICDVAEVKARLNDLHGRAARFLN